MSLLPWLQLSLTEGVGPVLSRRMIEFAGSPQVAVTLKRRELQQIEGIGIAKATGIEKSLSESLQQAEEQMARAKEFGATITCPDDPIWPELLRPLSDAPPVLYVWGTLEPRDLQSIAIVGSRRCSHYGREQAERFAALLAGAGCTVVSGGARGIDSAAHRGALQHPQGRTVAALGSGLDVPYPPENEKLFQQIAQRGAVISEFPFGTSPSPENFPRRNRVVSGVSRGVLVVEADVRSGALITARIANEDHGRPVFAIPGRVDNALSGGPHKLIRDGAVLVTGLEDIFEALDPLPDHVHQPALFDDPEDSETPPAASVPSLISAAHGTERQNQILDYLEDEASVDDLVERTGFSPAEILRELTFLSLKGLVKRVDGQTYSRGK